VIEVAIIARKSDREKYTKEKMLSIKAVRKLVHMEGL
jgi:hypothetical protein